MFQRTLDPTTGRIPEPRSPKRGRYGGASLAVYSRSRKHRAIARVELLGLYQCARMFLTLAINLGRGERCRSWWSDHTMAEIMNRSGMGSYSVAHVRRCRRLCEDVGLVRSTHVAPHSHHGCLGPERCKSGHFPAYDDPDVDGGGKRTSTGGRVIEVNLAAILGEGPLWAGPLREMGWTDAREAREAAEEQESAAAAEALAEAPRELEADPPPAAPAPIGDHCAAVQRVITSDHGGVITDAHSCDLAPASQEHSRDRGRATSERPGRAPLRGAETTANAGSALRARHDATADASSAAAATASPSGSPGPCESERQRTNEEQGARQGLGVAEGLIAARDLARLRAILPEIDWSFAAPRLVATPPASPPAGASNAPPGPAERGLPAAPLTLFAPRDLGQVGRHGERPTGWRGGGGGRRD